jgi:hypothetical protein
MKSTPGFILPMLAKLVKVLPEGPEGIRIKARRIPSGGG